MKRILGYSLVSLPFVVVLGGMQWLCIDRGMWWLLGAVIGGIIVFAGLFALGVKLLDRD